MNTQKQLQETNERLRQDLQNIEAQIRDNRDFLTRAAGSKSFDDKQAEGSAARVMILEAQAASLREAIARNQAESEKRDAILKSKEYRDAQKEIAELESYFKQEADDIHKIWLALRDRLQKMAVKHAKYAELVNRYGLELDNLQKLWKIGNADYVYLLVVLRAVEMEYQREQNAHPAPRKPDPTQKVAQAAPVHEDAKYWMPAGG